MMMYFKTFTLHLEPESIYRLINSLLLILLPIPKKLKLNGLEWSFIYQEREGLRPLQRLQPNEVSLEMKEITLDDNESF